MINEKFSGEVRETPEGLELELYEGDLRSIDYSDVFEDEEEVHEDSVLGTVEEALRLVYDRISKRSPEDPNFHGFLLVLADIYNRDGVLPLAEPIGDERRVIRNTYTESAEKLADVIYDIATDPKYHDGATIVDGDTRKVVGRGVWLLPLFIALNGQSVDGNGDGTRRSIALEYSKWDWATVYTISETDGRVVKYSNGKREEIIGPYEM